MFVYWWWFGFMLLGLFVVSVMKVRSRNNVEFIFHWGFPLGAFVWEDLMVFSFYW